MAHDQGMKLDIFMEFASPPDPGSGRARSGGVRTVFEDGLEVVRAADRLGFDAVWLAEHHFLGDYCNAAAPEMLLAAMARETDRIGLGFAISCWCSSANGRPSGDVPISVEIRGAGIAG